MRPSRWIQYLAVAGAAVAALGGVAGAQQSPPGDSYTAAQAAHGRATYIVRCAECHLPDLKGSAGPALAGSTFLSGWGTRTVRELFAFIKGSMPPGAEGSLSDETYLDVVAYILQANGHAEGIQALRADSAVLLAAGGGGARTPEGPARPQPDP